MDTPKTDKLDAILDILVKNLDDHEKEIFMLGYDTCYSMVKQINTGMDAVATRFYSTLGTPNAEKPAE